MTTTRGWRAAELHAAPDGVLQVGADFVRARPPRGQRQR